MNTAFTSLALFNKNCKPSHMTYLQSTNWGFTATIKLLPLISAHSLACEISQKRWGKVGTAHFAVDASLPNFPSWAWNSHRSLILRAFHCALLVQWPSFQSYSPLTTLPIPQPNAAFCSHAGKWAKCTCGPMLLGCSTPLILELNIRVILLGWGARQTWRKFPCLCGPTQIVSGTILILQW